MRSNVYSSDFAGIRFVPMSDSFIQSISVTPVTVADFGNNSGTRESLTSLAMGSNEDNVLCKTCEAKKTKCQGHYGHIDLGAHIYSPLFIQYIIQTLKVVCWNCGRIIIADTANKTLVQIRTAITSKVKKGITCDHCGHPHPSVYENKKDSKSTLAQELYMIEDGKVVKSWAKDLMASEVYEIFSRITPETLEKLGIFLPELAPVNFINKNFCVLPNSIRPNGNPNAKKTSKHDLNSQFNNILAASKQIFTHNGEIDIKNAIKKLQASVQNYQTSPPIGDNKVKSITTMITTKKGKIRGNVLGARITRTARNFVTGNPDARLDQIIVPLITAETIEIAVVVTPYNKEQLMRFVANGIKVYPRCHGIYKATVKRFYGLNVAKNITIEPGDIIYRDVITGDSASVCRQPTLQKSSIVALTIVVDTAACSLGINPNIVDYLGADFDGDEINLYFSEDPIPSFEMRMIGGSCDALISNGYGSPMAGQIQDGLLGIALITRDDITFSPFEAVKMFDNTRLVPDFLRVKSVNGREILTELFRLAGVKINYESKATYYKSNLNVYRIYSDTEINVVIRNGEFISGIIDKKAIGAKANGGIYHRIEIKYGAQKAIDLIWLMQRVATNYLLMHGYSINPDDFKVLPIEEKRIHIEESKIIAESINYTNKLYNNMIIPPPGKNLSSFFEAEQFKILTNTESYNLPIHKGINYLTNSLYTMINIGSKGSYTNLTDGIAACGQMSMKDARIPNTLHGRSSHFFPKHSYDPRSRGFIDKSYGTGLSPADFNNAAYPAREGLINKALATAVSGEAFRNAYCALNSHIVNYFYSVFAHHRLSQVLYGDTGMNPQTTYKFVSPLIKMPNSKIVGSELERKNLIESRDFMRQLFINLQHRTGEGFGSIGYIPININIILDDIVSEGTGSHYEKVHHFIQSIPKFYYAKNYEGEIPEYFVAATKLFQCYLYWEMRSEVINRFSAKQVEKIFDLIRAAFINNLESPGACVGLRASQAISEPNTQLSLDSIHGKAKNKILNFQNIFSVIPLERMKNPAMEIYLKYGDIHAIAKSIEMLDLKYFVQTYEIFFETFGNITYPSYVNENEIVREKSKIIQPPTNLINWCVRFNFDISKLIAQNIRVEDIYIKLLQKYPFLYIVHNTLNTQNVFMRLYFRMDGASSFNLNNTINIRKFIDILMNLTIRGIAGIKSTIVQTKTITQVTKDGDIEEIPVEYIMTEGSNLSEILMIPEVDGRFTRSNCIPEIHKFFGILCTQNAVMDGLRMAVENVAYCHYSVFTSEICALDYPSSLNGSGSLKRGADVTELIADSAVKRHIYSATKIGRIDTNRGVSASLIKGTLPHVGTNYSSVILNEKFINSHVSEKTEELENI